MRPSIRPTRQLRWWVIGIFILAGIWFIPTIHGGLEWALATSARPLTASGRWLNDHLFSSRNINQLRDERDELRQQLTDVTTQLHRSQLKLDVSRTIEQLSDYLAATNRSAVTAEVISYSADPGIKSLTINQGQKAGLKIGQAVVTDDGFLIGRIQIAHQSTATVLLLTDPQSVVGSRIENSVGSLGLLTGERGLSLRMELIPKSDQIEAGQTVVTSGVDPIVPPDLLIGSVQKVISRPGELFQSAQILSPIQFNRVKIVAVINS